MVVSNPPTSVPLYEVIPKALVNVFVLSNILLSPSLPMKPISVCYSLTYLIASARLVLFPGKLSTLPILVVAALTSLAKVLVVLYVAFSSVVQI